MAFLSVRKQNRGQSQSHSSPSLPMRTTDRNAMSRLQRPTFAETQFALSDSAEMTQRRAASRRTQLPVQNRTASVFPAFPAPFAFRFFKKQTSIYYSSYHFPLYFASTFLRDGQNLFLTNAPYQLIMKKKEREKPLWNEQIRSRLHWESCWSH